MIRKSKRSLPIAVIIPEELRRAALIVTLCSRQTGMRDKLRNAATEGSTRVQFL